MCKRRRKRNFFLRRANVQSLPRKDKCHYVQTTLLPSPFNEFLLCDILWYGIYIWVSCPGYVPSQLLVPPWWSGGEAEKVLALCKPCSALGKASLYYQHCLQAKSKTQPPARDYEEN